MPLVAASNTVTSKPLIGILSPGLTDMWSIASRAAAKVLYRASTPLPEDCRSEEHTSELQSLRHLVCRLLLEKNIIRSDRLAGGGPPLSVLGAVAAAAVD